MQSIWPNASGARSYRNDVETSRTSAKRGAFFWTQLRKRPLPGTRRHSNPADREAALPAAGFQPWSGVCRTSTSLIHTVPAPSSTTFSLRRSGRWPFLR